MKVRVITSICACLVVSGVCTLRGAIIIVDAGGAGDYTTIEEAISDSNTGDEIIVRQGTYYETIDLGGKAITLRSTNPYDPNVVVNTIIDGKSRGSTITCKSGEDANTIIEGFVITGGRSSYGGGMHCDGTSPTVNNCTFADNTASSNGAGMYCADSNPTLTNCLFNGNDTISGDGAGIYCLRSNPALANCTFIDNEATAQLGDGGGMCCSDSSPTLNNCAFTDNWATRGGGISCGDSSPMLNNCTFTSNGAECECAAGANTGGGMYCYNSSNPTLINCTFIDNKADNDAGAVYCDHGSRAELAGTVICRNIPNEIVVLGDLDGDRVVGFADFAILADNWLKGD